MCIHAPTCGYGPALEHNGDLYTCDHFVEPDYKLGNIHTAPMIDLVASPQMRKFGDDKRDTLTAQCQIAMCGPYATAAARKTGSRSHGKVTPTTIIYAKGSQLFEPTKPSMQVMRQLFERGRRPADVMRCLAAEDAKASAYRPCSCGSGRKFKFCHGDKAPSKPFARQN